jgi:uncharacterized protein (DUF1697 family)
VATYIALLRAVNVGGTGKLPMARLKSLCEQLGFTQVRTVIASGNVLFASRAGAAQVQSRLEEALHEEMGKPVGVLLRTAGELRALLAAQPFAGRDAARCVVIFLPGPVPPDARGLVRGRTDEQVEWGQRELYVHYPGGQGASKLRIPAAAAGTARNLNTVAKLVELAGEMRA